MKSSLNPIHAGSMDHTTATLPARNVAGGSKPVCNPPASSRVTFRNYSPGVWGGGWAGLAVVVWLVASTAFAQPFTMEQGLISGGGGTSVGGGFELTGTIGQTAPGRASDGGVYALEGGFWGGYLVIQTPGAPSLSITRVNNTVEITWPVAGSAGYVLQGTTALGTTPNWVEEAAEPTVENTLKKVTLTIQPGHHFFRLLAVP